MNVAWLLAATAPPVGESVTLAPWVGLLLGLLLVPILFYERLQQRSLEGGRA